jgi:hypothetical protein
MPDNALGGYGRHVLVGLMDALPALKLSEKAIASARSLGSAAVSLSSSGICGR